MKLKGKMPNYKWKSAQNATQPTKNVDMCVCDDDFAALASYTCVCVCFVAGVAIKFPIWNSNQEIIKLPKKKETKVQRKQQ